jgi:hypothetical protein
VDSIKWENSSSQVTINCLISTVPNGLCFALSQLKWVLIAESHRTLDGETNIYWDSFFLRVDLPRFPSIGIIALVIHT